MAELAPPEHYSAQWKAWRLDVLPMLPEPFALAVSERNRSHFEQLLPLLRHAKVEALINACDAGREGELIFRYLMSLANCTKPAFRLWLQAMTPEAVRRGFSQLRSAREYDALADAAQCRAEADWLVGLNGTRALTVVQRRSYNGRAPLFSVGRVQTPTLAMLVAREEAIESFVSEEYYEATLAVHEAPKLVFRAIASKAEQFAAQRAASPHSERPAGRAATSTESTFRFARPEDARQACAQAQAQPGKVTAFKASEQPSLPPALHDLTSLQREANIRFGIKAADTLAAAQTLYETHKAITYPRTDSRYLPDEMGAALPALVQRLQAGAHAQLASELLQGGMDPHAARRVADSRKVSDHYAIVPTGVAVSLPQASPAGRVYELVLRRFFAALARPAITGHSRLELGFGDRRFEARGHSVVEPGWQRYEPPARKAGEAPALPAWPRGTPVSAKKAEVAKLSTKPPARLSEAALLLAMERAGRPPSSAARTSPDAAQQAMGRAGLGTPATRANIIETLKQRGYIEAVGRSLRPLEAGRQLLAALPSAALKSAELTSEWEEKLVQVAQGSLPRAQFMRDIAHFVRGMTTEIGGGSARVAKRAEPAAPRGRR